jgi:hypothetical protein
MKNLIALFDAICDVYDRPDLLPKSDGTTFCNIAVDAIAQVMGFKGFELKTADEIIGIMSSDPNWSIVAFEKAQDMANQGSLLVAGLTGQELGQSHGHVCVIRPGIPCFSGKWQATPRIVNIGAENFIARAKRGPLIGMAAGLNEAFVPMPKIWVWRPSL